MIYTPSAEFSKAASNDWCHICGNRNKPTVNIRYSENSEHMTLFRSVDQKFVRICTGCAAKVLREAASDGG